MIRLQVLYPPPPHILIPSPSSSPLPPLPPFSPTLRGSRFSVGGVRLPLLMSAVGHAQKASPPPPPLHYTHRQASVYLLACLYVFLSFGHAVRSPIAPPFLAPVLSPSPVPSKHSGVVMNLVSTWGRWRGRSPWRAKWVETVREASARTPPTPNVTPPVACMVKQPWGSCLRDHRGY